MKKKTTRKEKIICKIIDIIIIFLCSLVPYWTGTTTKGETLILAVAVMIYMKIGEILWEVSKNG